MSNQETVKVEFEVMVLRRMVAVLVVTLVIAGPATAFIEEDYDRLMQAVEAGQPIECDKCNLSYANLSDLDLTGASLNGAYLYGAKLRGTVLRDAKLDRADFTRSDLEGADFTGASLSEIRAVSTKWCGTIMPDGSKNDSRC